MTANMLVDMVVLIVGTTSVYVALVCLANQYSQRTNWQPPEESRDSDWALRHRLSLAVGSFAIMVCAMCSMLWIDTWPARIMTSVQAALMAAAGTSDLRRFHLPLPLTLAGIGIAVLAMVVLHVSTFLLLFALFWSLLVIGMHILLSRGSMQLGDHIATIWIALASPLNGLLAVMAGDSANVALAQIKGLRGKKVAAAGAWLICAAALSGLPPYFAWFTSRPPLSDRAPLPAIASTTTLEHPGASGEQQMLTTAALIKLAGWAGEHTASVAFHDRRADRIVAAKNESVYVAQCARLAKQIAPGSGVAIALDALAAALNTYDVESVRSASLKLAEEQQTLSTIVGAQQVQSIESSNETLH